MLPLLFSRMQNQFPPGANPLRIFGSSLKLDLDAQEPGTLWQDAAKTVPASAGGDACYVWAGRGAAIDATQASAGTRPTLAIDAFGTGKNGLLMGGTKTLQTSNFFSSESLGFTFWIVKKLDAPAPSPGTPHPFQVSASNSDINFYSNQKDDLMGFSMASANGYCLSIDNAIGIEVVTWSPSTVNIYCNGYESHLAKTGPIPLVNSLIIGSYISGFNWNGHIGAVGFSSGAASPAQKTALISYLQDRWGKIVGNTTSPIICFDGNSISYLPVGSNYTVKVMAKSPYNSGWLGPNFASSGKTTVDESAKAYATIVPLYSSKRTNNIAVLWEISNEIAPGGLDHDAATALTNYKNWCTTVRSAGYKVVCLTVLPRTDQGAGNATFEARRVTCNTELRDSANVGVYWDIVCDVAADGRLSTVNATYYDASNVHLNDAGAQVVADLVAATIDLIRV